VLPYKVTSIIECNTIVHSSFQLKLAFKCSIVLVLDDDPLIICGNVGKSQIGYR
jgi:hypothetical protein